MADIGEHHHNRLLPTAAEARHRPAPDNWQSFNSKIRHRWLVPLLFVDWLAEWAAYVMSRLSLLELLEYCGSFSILIGLVIYIVEAPQRLKMKHYQAWQVINTAQGKGGSGGRIEALHELNEDHIPLVGVDVGGAFLQGVQLIRADIHRADFHAADLRDADLTGADMAFCNLDSANLQCARLDGVDLTDAILANSDLTEARLAGADLTKADLRDADLANIVDWKSVKSFRLANIHGIVHAPQGFAEFAIEQGAVDAAGTPEWVALIGKSTTRPDHP